MKSVICSSSGAPAGRRAGERARAPPRATRWPARAPARGRARTRRSACRGARRCRWACRAPRPYRSRRGCRQRSERALRAPRQTDRSRIVSGSAGLAQVQHALDARSDQPPGLQRVQPPQPVRALRGRARSTSRYCPPTIPSTPVAPASRPIARSSVGGVAVLVGDHVAEAPRRTARRRRGSRRPRRTRRGRSGDRGAGRRRPSPAGRRGSASRCGSARSPPRAASPPAGRDRSRSRSRAPAPGGSACPARAASSASPPRARRDRHRR